VIYCFQTLLSNSTCAATAGVVAEEARLLRLALGGGGGGGGDVISTAGGAGGDSISTTGVTGGGGGSIAGSESESSGAGAVAGAGAGSEAGGECSGFRVSMTGSDVTGSGASCVELAELVYLAARLQERCGRAERELAKLAAQAAAIPAASPQPAAPRR